MQQWHILMVEANREHVVSAHLRGRRFRPYLPMVMARELRPYPTTARRPNRMLPMFRGYVFALIDPDQPLAELSSYPQFSPHKGNVLQRVKSIPGMRGLLTMNGKFATLSEDAIVQIFELEQELMKEKQNKPKAPFQPGEKVRTTDSAGVWSGLQGIVERLDKQDKVVLSLLLPGRHTTAATASMPAQWLEPVSDAPRARRRACAVASC